MLPPSVRDELGEDHLCFFVRRVVRRLDRSGFEQAYAAEGGALYAPEWMLSVWLYGYALGITSARRLERLKKSGFSNLARALNLGVSCRGNVCAAAHRRMRAKLRSPAGQAVYARRKAVVEPVFGVFETTARNAPVSHPRAGPSEQRVHPGHDGLQPNPAAHHASRLRRSRKPKPAPGAPAETAASGKT